MSGRSRVAVGALVSIVLASAANCGAPSAAGAPALAVSATPVVSAPPSDRDHDGISDNDDRCPDAPEDCDGFEDGDGCPDDDNDNDGVPDWCDRCPTIPGGTDGCPTLLLDSERQILVQATFKKNDTVPIIESGRVDALVELFPRGTVQRLGIVGHAAPAEKAARLATRRAEAVRALLVARGAPTDQIEVQGAAAGDLERCLGSPDGGPPTPCVSFVLVQAGDIRHRWDGTRYVEDPRPRPPPPVCPPKPPVEGHPCGAP
jgi:hypothetical protein